MHKIYSLSKQIDEGMQVLFDTRKLNFLLIELYFSFTDTFPVYLKSAAHLKQKLGKVRVEKLSEDIKKVGYPCLEVNGETGKIEQLNN